VSFVGSGHLRNIVRTVNELPSDYSGELTILLNDDRILTVARNIMLLLKLGCTPNVKDAAEYALHIWYSAFMPIDYDLEVKSTLSLLLDNLQENKLGNITFSSPLSQTSNLSSMIIPGVIEWYCHMVQSKIDRASAIAELKRVRCDLVITFLLILRS
jgi:Domain of unknown function (DUF4470)